MGLRSVLSFLSRIPAGNGSPEDLAASLPLFPVVGIILGAILGGAAFFTYFLLPHWLAALVFLLELFLLKGFLHLDGLADVSDALASHAPVEVRQRILKDPHIGTAGTVAVVLFLLFLGVTLLSFPLYRDVGGFLSRTAFRGHALPWALAFAVLLAEVNATCAMVLTLSLGKPSPVSILAKPLVERATPGVAALAMGVAGIVTLLIGGILLLATLGAFLLSLYVARVATRRLGGINGDVVGAVHQVVFLFTLVLAAILPWSALI